MHELQTAWEKAHRNRKHGNVSSSYYERHKDKAIAYQKEWLKKNPNYSHEYYLAHRDKYIERAKKSRAKNKLKNR